MRKKLLFAAVVLEMLLIGGISAKPDTFQLGSSNASHVTVNNRVLAKVNGKAISVVDVMKKLDMYFYKQFPQYVNIPEAHYQFYTANWQHVLGELIDKELVLADAEENKMPISSGDVRQELELLFGPNIIANLDKVGLSFDEAWKIVRGDIIIKRMLYARVNVKALGDVTPQKVRDAYDEYTKKNTKDDEWQYYVMTIRDQDPLEGAKTAQLAYRLATEDKIPLESIPKKIEERTGPDSKSNVSISEKFLHTEKQMSEAYRKTLITLKPDTYSEPISQKSRKDQNTVYRIFLLKTILPGGIPPFNEIAPQLKNKLLDEAVGKESQIYLEKLRKRYGINEEELKKMFDANFQPFTLS
jgi:hypothetical protein